MRINTAFNRPKAPKGERGAAFSPDRRWKSFPRTPHLVQYVSTGRYYGRVRVRGKTVRQGLKTTVYSDAVLRLSDFLKGQRTKPPRNGDEPKTVEQAIALYEAEVETRHDLKPRAKEYRMGCVKALKKTWPGFERKQLIRITEQDCVEWAQRFTERYEAHYFDQTLSTLRAILDRGALNPNSARAVKRRGVVPRELKLPEPEQFRALLETIETAGGRFSQDCADLVRFLAFSGARLGEAKAVSWADVDLASGKMRLSNSKVRLTNNAPRLREIPIISDSR